jgi:hypothetical protein
MRITVFDSYILEGDVFDLRAVSMLNIHHYRVTVNEIAIAEFDVFHSGRACLGTDLKASAPIAPDNATLRKNIGYGKLIVHLQALNYDAIVKVAQITVSDNGVLTVREITAVGVVSPHSDKLDVVNSDVSAGGKMHAPNAGVDYRDALDLHVFTVKKTDRTARASSIYVSVVEYAVSQHTDVFLSVSSDRAAYDCSAVNVDGGVIIKRDRFTHSVNACPKIDYLSVILVDIELLFGIYEYCQNVVLIVKFDRILTNTGQSDGYLAIFSLWFDIL